MIFTSLEYGDMPPPLEWEEVLAMVEVFVGVALISVLVGCVLRKLIR